MPTPTSTPAFVHLFQGGGSGGCKQGEAVLPCSYTKICSNPLRHVQGNAQGLHVREACVKRDRKLILYLGLSLLPC